MESFAYRLISLGARFMCPLMVLFLSTPATMGKYYLFTTYFTFIVFLIALELGVPFSARYLLASDEPAKRQVFSEFVGTQLGLSIVLAAPAAYVYYLNTAISPFIAVVFGLAIISETCVNELGRFFWNIGQVRVASRRDLVRSLVFVTAILTSVISRNEVVSAISLGIIIACNGAILIFEARKWGALQTSVAANPPSVWAHLLLLPRRVRQMVAESLPQVVHIQLLALVPLLERALIEKRAGLEMVASYSFQYSIVQTGASLFMLPVVAEVRRNILGSASETDVSHAKQASLHLLLKILLVAALLSLLVHFFIPIIGLLTGKHIDASWGAVAAAFLSSCMATFAAAISPSFANKSRLFAANIATVICLLPLLVGFLSLPMFFSSSQGMPMLLIALAAVAQLMVRAVFLADRGKKNIAGVY